MAIGDGAHPPVRFPAGPGAVASLAGQPLLVVRGVDPQLFLRWPSGRVLWIWGGQGLADLSRLEARLAPAPPPDCVAAAPGAGPALVVTAVAEDDRSTCTSWELYPVQVPQGGARCAPIAVPDLIGLPLSEARAILEALELAAGTIAERPSEEEPTVVLEQDPAGGSGRALATGDLIDLVVAGQQLVRVPDITGRTVAAAAALVRPLELLLAARSAGAEVAVGSVSGYRIDEQTPAAGELAAVGSAIEIAVSLLLPDLRGRPAAEALSLLDGYGLRPAWAGLELPADPQLLEPYRIGLHRPSPGAPVSWGGQVELDVEVTVPELRGLRPAAASRLLGERSLVLERTAAEVADVDAERIRRQRPAAGQPLAPGSPVRAEIEVLTPAIEGESVGAALERLAARGLGLELEPPAVREEWRSSTERHRLETQRPRPGQLLPVGSPVAARLAVEMPNLRWQPAAAAMARLRRLGLDPGRPLPRTGLSRRQRVSSQSPEPGTWLAAGTAVQLTLGPGLPPPPPSPRWPWLWLAVVAALGSALLRRLRPRRLRLEGHRDYGNQRVAAKGAGAGPPAVRLQPRWDAGRQTIRIHPGGSTDAAT